MADSPNQAAEIRALPSSVLNTALALSFASPGFHNVILKIWRPEQNLWFRFCWHCFFLKGWNILEDYAIPPCHACSFRLAAGAPFQVQAHGTWNAGFNCRDMTSICNPVIFSFTFDISILCIFFPFPPSTSAVGKHVLVCGSFQMASSCSDLDLSVYPCCPHSYLH